jgi:hypothetical protein
MKIIKIITILLLFSFYSFGQCSLKSEDLPALRGMKLGTDPVDILKIYPAAEFSPVDEIGGQKILIHSYNIRSNELKQNLNAIRVQLLDGKIVSFSIEYDNSVKWDGVSSFTKSLSKNLSIPEDSWKNGDFYATAECADFNIRASLLGLPELKIELTELPQIIKNRNSELEEKKRKAFKP